MATLDMLDINAMLRALVEAKVPYELDPSWDQEETYNYIIDKFDTFIIGYIYGYEAKSDFVTTICDKKNGYIRRQYEWRMTQ